MIFAMQSIITLVFFITYIIFQPPATVLTRKIGPRIFLAGLCIAWGAVMIGMGFTHNWAALAACRVILGLLEAGFFPVSEHTAISAFKLPAKSVSRAAFTCFRPGTFATTWASDTRFSIFLAWSLLPSAVFSLSVSCK